MKYRVNLHIDVRPLIDDTITKIEETLNSFGINKSIGVESVINDYLTFTTDRLLTNEELKTLSNTFEEEFKKHLSFKGIRIEIQVC